MDQINNIKRDIVDLNVKRIIVNLPHVHFTFKNDFVPFMALGELIKEKQLDLHIVGGCGVYCASYLLPAAKTVYIEPPYGYITVRGNFEGVHESMSPWLSLLKKREQTVLTDVFLNKAQPHFSSQVQPHVFMLNQLKAAIKKEQGDSSSSLSSKSGLLLELLLVLYDDKIKQRILSHLEKFVSDPDTKPSNINDLSVEEQINFVSRLPQDLVEALYVGFKLKGDRHFKEISSDFQMTEAFALQESDYYEKIKANQTASQEDYSYRDFLRVASFFVKYPSYRSYKAKSPEFYYNSFLEKDKFSWILPSGGLLRDLGLDVRGDNNIRRVMGFVKGFRKEFLYLDSEGVKNCLSKSITHTKQTFGKCLSN